MPFLGKTPTKLLDANVNIDGGNIDGTTIGASSTAPATVSTFTSTGIDDNATSTAITIDSGGNVTIDGSDASTSLASTAILNLKAGDANNEYSILRFATSADGSIAYIGAKATTTGAYPSSVGNLEFGVQNGASTVTAMTLDSSGNVGIGTSIPDGKLNVVKGTASGTTASTSANNIVIDGTSGTETGITLFSTVASGIRFGDASGASQGVIEYGHATNYMRFVTNAAERMRIDGSGNVGIGTTSPNYALDVVGNIRATNSSGSTIIVNRASNPGSVEFQYNGTQTAQFSAISGGGLATYVGSPPSEVMRIDASGNVGIGTSSPSRELEIRLADDTTTTLGQKGGISLYAPSNTGGNGGEITWASAVNGEVWAAISGHITSNGSGVASGDLVFGTGDNSALPTERMRITANGSVGIGTTSPAYKLSVHVNAVGTTYPLKIENSNATSGNGVGILFTHRAHSGDNQGSIEYVGAGANNTNSMLFKTEANGVNGLAERMRIDSSGNLLVGATSASARFQVDHSSAATPTGLFLNQNTATSGVGAIQTSIPSQSNNTNCYHFKGTTQGVASYFLYGNGTSSFTSDERQKKNIVATRDGYLDDLKRLRVVDYHWNTQEDTEDKSVGLIAQEVEQVFPHLVVEHEMEGVGLRKNLRGSEFTFVLIKAIQEQQAMIEELKAEVAALKGE